MAGRFVGEWARFNPAAGGFPVFPPYLSASFLPDFFHCFYPNIHRNTPETGIFRKSRHTLYPCGFRAVSDLFHVSCLLTFPCAGRFPVRRFAGCRRKRKEMETGCVFFRRGRLPRPVEKTGEQEGDGREISGWPAMFFRLQGEKRRVLLTGNVC